MPTIKSFTPTVPISLLLIKTVMNHWAYGTVQQGWKNAIKKKKRGWRTGGILIPPEDKHSQKGNESLVTSNKDLAALVQGSVKCTVKKESFPLQRKQKKEDFDRYMKLIYTVGCPPVSTLIWRLFLTQINFEKVCLESKSSMPVNVEKNKELQQKNKQTKKISKSIFSLLSSLGSAILQSQSLIYPVNSDRSSLLKWITILHTWPKIFQKVWSKGSRLHKRF